MPVLLERTEKTTIQNENEQPKKDISVHAVITCDGPNCPTGSCPGTLEWTESGTGEGVPNEAFRMLTLIDFYGKRVVFLKKECLRDYMRGYNAPLSPTELADMMKNNQQVELEKNKDLSQAAAEAITGENK